MITEEQIKNLKRGDSIVIYTTVDHIDDDGDLWFYCPQVNDNDWLEYINPKFVSLPGETMEKSKYDPCRPFKEGDRVKPRKLFGRYYSKATARIIDKICTVLHDEIEHYTVSIRWDEGECNIDPAYLELVTPVEELELYCVRKYSSFYAVEKHNNIKDRPATYDIDFHPHAKEAAEAECKRLNAEYRKEQV